MLEAEEVGYGGSGRNAGHCTPTFHFYSIPRVRRMLGEPWAERLIQRQTNAANLVGRLIEEHGIDCEWRQTGYLHAAHTPSALAGLEEHNRQYVAVGKATRVLDREETRRLTGSERYFGAWFHPEGGHLNPLGYARGLARAALGKGAQVFVRSRVTGIEPRGTRWAVRTARGTVTADKVVCGTGAYTDRYWPGLERSFAIGTVFVAATQPLSENVRKSVLPNNTTMHDGRGDIFVYKYDKEGRIVASMWPSGRRGPRSRVYPPGHDREAALAAPADRRGGLAVPLVRRPRPAAPHHPAPLRARTRRGRLARLFRPRRADRDDDGHGARGLGTGHAGAGPGAQARAAAGRALLHGDRTAPAGLLLPLARQPGGTTGPHQAAAA